MEIVYLETTIVSYLTAHPSRDLVVNAHQQITREWWEVAKNRFKLRISEAVLEEISRGDPDASKRRKEIIKDIPIYELNEDVRKFVFYYEEKLGLPESAKVDLVHIAFAVSYEVDYLMTWNCAHIANGEVIRKLIQLNNDMNRVTPLILTPEELLEPFTREDI